MAAPPEIHKRLGTTSAIARIAQTVHSTMNAATVSAAIMVMPSVSRQKARRAAGKDGRVCSASTALGARRNFDWLA